MSDKMRSLYVSYNGMTEPLGQSQVVPYLHGLARAGWTIDVVAFEPPTASADDLQRVVDDLARDRITYRYARRSPSHAPAMKAFEIARAFSTLIARSLAARPRIIHARSHLPALAAHAAATLVPGARFLFDCRGLLGDEYADVGWWSRDSLKYKTLKRVEKHLFARADAVVTLTERLRRWLLDEHLVDARTPTEVIPCCVDMERFPLSATLRQDARARLGAGERFVLAYSGTLGSWYREVEMARLYAALRKKRPSLFLVLTRSPSEKLREELRALGVPDEEVHLRAVPPREMADALAAADAGVSFIEPCFSKMASSPTKVAEYLALGLPVAMNRGVGDCDLMIADCPAAIDAGHLTNESIAAAADRLSSMSWTTADREAAREYARTHFSVEEVGVARYRRLYERLSG